MRLFGGSATVSWPEGQELGQKLCVSTFRLVCRFQRPIKISTNSLGRSKAYASTEKGQIGMLSHSQSDVGKHNWWGTIFVHPGLFNLCSSFDWHIRCGSDFDQKKDSQKDLPKGALRRTAMGWLNSRQSCLIAIARRRLSFIDSMRLAAR